ncbi:unnamed protein product, partial [Adineta steineri]
MKKDQCSRARLASSRADVFGVEIDEDERGGFALHFLVAVEEDLSGFAAVSISFSNSCVDEN